MDTEAEAIRGAIYDIGIVEELKKERDAALGKFDRIDPEGVRMCQG